MQYMLLIYSSPDLEPVYGSPEFQAMMAEFSTFNDKTKQDGVLVGGEGLQAVETATSIRLRNGKVETMDGPFAETKEHLGGYYILDVSGLDSALKYASMIPVARFGTIEIRPLMDYNPAN